MFIFLFMTNLFMSDSFIILTQKIVHVLAPPPPYISPPLYKPIKNRLRKYISPGLIVEGLRYQLKNKYAPLANNFAKGYRSVVTHVLYHFCDTSLITACAIFCSLMFHVVCTSTFFGDTICLLTNWKMIKIVTLHD